MKELGQKQGQIHDKKAFKGQSIERVLLERVGGNQRLQCLGTEKAASSTDLSHLREELGQSLEVAKQVERRMGQIDRDLERRGDV